MTTFMERPTITTNSDSAPDSAPRPGTPAYQAYLAKEKQKRLQREAEEELANSKIRSKLAYSVVGSTVTRGDGRVEEPSTPHVESDFEKKRNESLEALRQLDPELKGAEPLYAPKTDEQLDDEDDDDYDDDEFVIPGSDQSGIHANERREKRKAQLRTVEQDADYSEDDFGDYEDDTHLDTTMVKGELKDFGHDLRTKPSKVKFDKTVRISYRDQADKE